MGERGIEHKNPSKALFCYLEDNFHFNWHLNLVTCIFLTILWVSMLFQVTLQY